MIPLLCVVAVLCVLLCFWDRVFTGASQPSSLGNYRDPVTGRLERVQVEEFRDNGRMAYVHILGTENYLWVNTRYLSPVD